MHHWTARNKLTQTCASNKEFTVKKDSNVRFVRSETTFFWLSKIFLAHSKVPRVSRLSNNIWKMNDWISRATMKVTHQGLIGTRKFLGNHVLHLNLSEILLSFAWLHFAHLPHFSLHWLPLLIYQVDKVSSSVSPPYSCGALWPGISRQGNLTGLS